MLSCPLTSDSMSLGLLLPLFAEYGEVQHHVVVPGKEPHGHGVGKQQIRIGGSWEGARSHTLVNFHPVAVSRPAYLYFDSTEAAAAAADALSVLCYDDVTIHVKDVTPKKAMPGGGFCASPSRTPVFDATAPTATDGSPAHPRSPTHRAAVAGTAHGPSVTMDAVLAMAAQVEADAQAKAVAPVAAASSGTIYAASPAQPAASSAQPAATPEHRQRTPAAVTTTYVDVPKNISYL